MDTRRLTFFVNVSTVLLLVHEVLFVKCDLKTKTHGYPAKTRVDGFRRHGRQAPTDPSRMYLPPDKNAIASHGFGGPADAPNNFDGHGATAAPVPNARRTKDGPWTENGDYDLSTRTTNGLDGVQKTVGPYGRVPDGHNNDDSMSSSLPASAAGHGRSCLLGNNDGGTSTTGGHDRGGLSNPTADGFGHGQPAPGPGRPRTSNGHHGRVVSRIPSSSVYRGGPSAYGDSVSSAEGNGYTRTGADTGDKGDLGSAATTGNGAASSSRQSSSTGRGQGGTRGPPSTGTPTDPGHGIRNQNKHSTIVPKDRYQNSNSPDGGFERRTTGSYAPTTDANGDEPGSNAFSNFAPGNRPNRPSTNVGSGTSYDSTTNDDGGGDYGEPGSNAFSNFAPDNRPNRPQPISPSNVNCDRNSNHVNDASKLTEAVFPSSNAGY